MAFSSKYTKTLGDKFWTAFGGGAKNSTKKEIDGALHYAAITNKLWRADFLIRARAGDVHSSEGFCMRWAARGGHIEMLSLLIGHGADVNAKDGEPLINALEKGHDDAATFLIDHGADAGLHKAKALYIAHERHNVAMLEIILASRAQLEPQARALLEKAKEREQQDLVGVYERYLGIAPPNPKKTVPPKLK